MGWCWKKSKAETSGAHQSLVMESDKIVMRVQQAMGSRLFGRRLTKMPMAGYQQKPSIYKYGGITRKEWTR